MQSYQQYISCANDADFTCSNAERVMRWCGGVYDWQQVRIPDLSAYDLWLKDEIKSEADDDTETDEVELEDDDIETEFVLTSGFRSSDADTFRHCEELCEDSQLFKELVGKLDRLSWLPILHYSCDGDDGFYDAMLCIDKRSEWFNYVVVQTSYTRGILLSLAAFKQCIAEWDSDEVGNFDSDTQLPFFSGHEEHLAVREGWCERPVNFVDKSVKFVFPGQ